MKKAGLAPIGLLFVISESAPYFEEEYNAWYDSEHIPERLAVPGIVSARRYISAERPRRYLALYDLEDLDVLESDAYKAVAGTNYTPWTKRVLSRTRFIRVVAIRISTGGGTTSNSSRLLALRFTGIDKEAGAEIAATAQTLFSDGAAPAQVRTFAVADASRDGFIVIIAGYGDLEARLDSSAFGRTAAGLSMSETFMPY